MTDNDQWLLQVSLKTSGQSLINIRGMSSTDIEAGLDNIIELADKIAEAETAVGAVQMVKHAMPGSTVQAPPVPPAGAGPAGPSAPAPNCDHGLPAKFVPGGVSKAGKPYAAFWACAQDRAYQCKFRQTA